MMPKPLQVHKFNESAAWAMEMAQQPFMEKMYRYAFPNFESSFIVRTDGWAQRGGIDRKINLKSARSVFVEEKFRGSDYHDFLLERWSDRDRRKPGWIQQDLLADYVAYVIMPRKTMFLIPYLDLRRAWVRHGRNWCATYKNKEAGNPRYTTVSVPVPERAMFNAILRGMELRWSDEPGPAIASRQISLPFMKESA